MGVFRGRYKAQLEGDFVVFLIGMRVNKPWKVHRWIPVALAMPRMLRELERSPNSGFLGATPALFTTGPTVVQYWRSFDQLESYARDPDGEHFPAWKRFNQQVRNSGDVGVWHETYRVRDGDYESIFANMPRVGLARAGQHMALGSTSTAARRIGVRPEDQPPITGY